MSQSLAWEVLVASNYTASAIATGEPMNYSLEHPEDQTSHCLLVQAGLGWHSAKRLTERSLERFQRCHPNYLRLGCSRVEAAGLVVLSNLCSHAERVGRHQEGLDKQDLGFHPDCPSWDQQASAKIRHVRQAAPTEDYDHHQRVCQTYQSR